MTPRGERGQAIVVIALIIAVLCGMLGLAIDGGRGFFARRAIQNGADASADAAAVAYGRSLDYQTAETAQVEVYKANRGIGGAPTDFQCTPAIPQVPPSGGTVAMRCTFPADPGQDMALAVTNRPDPVNVIQFWTGGQEQLATALIQIVGAGPSFPVAAQGVAWWSPSGFPSGPYGCSVPPGTDPYGPAPSGWSGPWPPSCTQPTQGGGPTPSPGGGPSPGPTPSPGGPPGGSIPPVVLALSGACGGAADALTVSGSSQHPAVIGNVVSYGDVVGTVTSGGGTVVPVAADTTAYCQAPTGIVGWCYPSGNAPGVGGCTGGSTFQYGKPAPPGYTVQAVNSGIPTGTPGTSINIQPGILPTPAVFAGPSAHTCTFLAAGVYQAPASTPNGVFSNELRPPDEPAIGQLNPTTTVQSPQFWDQNGANCAGKYGLTAVLDVPGPSLPAPADGVPLPAGAYAVRITSVRSDNGVTRESSPSICRTLSLAAPSALQISISNAPGATAYNVYLSTASINAALTAQGLSVGVGGTCSGPFYQVGQLAVVSPQLETNADTSGCPSLTQTPTCGLGVTVGAFDLTQVNLITNFINTGQLPPPPPLPCAQVLQSNCLPLTSAVSEFQAPAGSGLPDRDPVIGSDRANWGFYVRQSSTCQSGVTAPNTANGYDPSCWLTPGGVIWQDTSAIYCFDFSGGTRTSPSGATDFLFSGYQYAWAEALQPALQQNPQPCSNYFSGSFGTEFIGHVDVPQATAYVSGNNTSAPAVYGTFTANQVVINSDQGLAVEFVPPPDNTTGYGMPVP